MRHWPLFVPPIALLVLIAGIVSPMTALLLVLCVAALLAAVVAAVHHAEVIAHRVGEPYGTLVLALAITVIEVALVLSVMLAGGAGAAAVARDTVYASVMVICNAAVGICLLLGGIRHGEQWFRIEGTGTGLAALVALATLVLVVPALTTSAPGGAYTSAQLVFVALSSVTLWAAFVFIQTVRHRDYFLPSLEVDDETRHAAPPPSARAWISFGLLLAALVSVVGLAKVMSPIIEAAVVSVDAPKAVVGIIIAVIVLMPETWAAMRAARANRLQTSMNLAIGSALASIGLTIPAVVGAAVLLDLPLTLGLAPKDIAMLALTFVVSAITLGSGRTNMMHGVVHLAIFAAFMFLTLVP